MNEETIHLYIANYLRMALLSSVVWTSIEVSNQQGGTAGKIKQAKLFNKGVRTGWPDIQIFWREGGVLNALLLEVKTKRNSTTAKQKECHIDLASLGMPVKIVRSIDDVREALQEHNVPNRDKMA